jgi:hypothetical protein
LSTPPSYVASIDSSMAGSQDCYCIVGPFGEGSQPFNSIMPPRGDHHHGLPGWKRVWKPECTTDATTCHQPARLGGAMFTPPPHGKHRPTQTSCEGTYRVIQSESGFQTSVHGASSRGAKSHKTKGDK